MPKTRVMGSVAALIAVPLAMARPQAGPRAASVLSEARARNSEVRLAAEGTRLSGWLIALTDTSVTLDLQGRPGVFGLTVPLAAIDTVWIRQRATGTGAMIGAGVGLLAGGFIAAAVIEAGEGGSISSDEWGHILRGAAIGAAGGGLLGAIIGSAIPRWKLHFP